MPVESDADRAAFVDTGEFGASAVWTTASGAKPAIACIYDADYLLMAPALLDGGAEASLPQFVCRTKDVPDDAAHDDTVAVSRLDDAGDAVALGTFKVVEMKPDGTGMTTVRLQES